MNMQKMKKDDIIAIVLRQDDTIAALRKEVQELKDELEVVHANADKAVEAEHKRCEAAIHDCEGTVSALEIAKKQVAAMKENFEVANTKLDEQRKVIATQEDTISTTERKLNVAYRWIAIVAAVAVVELFYIFATI